MYFSDSIWTNFSLYMWELMGKKIHQNAEFKLPDDVSYLAEDLDSYLNMFTEVIL